MDLMDKIKRITNPLTLDEAVDSFITSIYGIRSPNTVEWYANVLNSLYEHFDHNQLIRNITLTDLRSWRASLYQRRVKYIGRTSHPRVEGALSPFTIYSMVQVSKTFFRWLVAEGYLTDNPSERLESPPKPQSTRSGITDEDAEAIIQASKGCLRDYALVLFLRDTGCRRAGAAGVKLADLNLSAPQRHMRYRVKVTEKGNRSRLVFLGDRSMKALRMWLEVRPNYAKPGCEYVFISLGSGTKGSGIAPSTVTGILVKLAEAAGVKENYSPHQWRHAFSRRMIAGHANLGVVQQILGHRSVNTTMEFYGGLSVDQLQTTLEECRPRDLSDFDYDKPQEGV